MKTITRYICVLTLSLCFANVWAQRPGVMPDSLPAKVLPNENANDNDEPSLFIPEEDMEEVTAPTWEQTLQAQLDKLMGHSLLETSHVGLMVWDLTADSCLYRHGERQRLRPASTMKLLTAITALDQLGADYRFSTELWSKGDLVLNEDSTHTFKGNFYCVGGLDPRFSNNDMTVFAKAIATMGADSIKGSILADRSFKDNKMLGEGWCWDDDNPTLSPLLVGKKDVFAETLRKQVQGGKAVVWMSTGEGAKPATGAQMMSRVERPIEEVLKPMMKNSDNLCAEAVFYQIAHRRKGKNASAADGRQQIYDVMRKAGLNTSAYYVADGSGLSLYNYVTAQAEVMMLRYAYSHTAIYEALNRSLPVAGVDGTLAGRMKGSNTKANVRAKTGTVTGVSSLAGYCKGGNGHQLCFAIINQGVKNPSDGRNFQDSVCTLLCK